MKHSHKQLFLKAYEEYADSIYRHCVVRVSDSERAMELMQETFLRALESLQQGTSIKNMRAFLYKIANNLIIDYNGRKYTIEMELGSVDANTILSTFKFLPLGSR